MSQPRLSECSQRGYSWVVTYGNPRKREFFKTKDDANTRFRELGGIALREGAAGLVMDSKARAEYFAALELLEGRGVGVLEVVQRFVQANPAGNGSMEWKPALRAFIDEKERRGRTDATTGTLERILEAFATTCAPVKVGDVSHEDIEAFVFDSDVVGRTQIKRRAVLGNFFGWLVRKGKLVENPVAKVDMPHAKATTAKVYGEAEIVRIFKAAKKRDALRYYAIAALAGLRQSELLALPENAISADHIAVVDIGKKGGRTKRVVPVCPRLRQILEETKGERIKWHPKLHQEVKREAGVEWQCDVLRHTWFSFRLAFTGDAARTSMEGGNDPATMARYYINAKTKESAAAYFGEKIEAPKPVAKGKSKSKGVQKGQKSR